MAWQTLQHVLFVTLFLEANTSSQHYWQSPPELNPKFCDACHMNLRYKSLRESRRMLTEQTYPLDPEIKHKHERTLLRVASPVERGRLSMHTSEHPVSAPVVG